MIETTKTIIATPSNSPGFTLTLESTGVLLTILVSISILLGIGIKLVSDFNNITSALRDLREDLNTHANSEGHIKIVKKVKLLQNNLINFDKKYAVHLQDYVNYKDASLLAFNGTRESVAHKWQRTEVELSGVKGSIKNLESFLQKRDDFKIRDDKF